MKSISLTQGYEALIDDEDYVLLSSKEWQAKVLPDGRIYAIGITPGSRSSRRTLYMHRVILGTTDSSIRIDHINLNGLDNRKENLRIATNGQNVANARKIDPLASSRYKGVSWHKACKRWSANVTHQGKTKHLGYFSNEKDAARAYDAAATEVFGEYARTNVMLGLLEG